MPESTEWDHLIEALEALDRDRLTRSLEELSVEEQRRAFSRLTRDQQTGVVSLLEPAFAAAVMERLPDSQATDLLHAVDPSISAPILEKLPEETIASILRQFGLRQSDAILEKIKDSSEVQSLRERISYPPNTAGALMNPQVAAFPKTLRVGDLLGLLGEESSDFTETEIQYIYTLHDDSALAGVVPLRNLVVAPRRSTLESIMIPQPDFVSTDDDLKSLEAAFKERHFLGLPVLEPVSGILRGVVSRTAVVEARARRDVSDFRQSRGIIGGDELRSMPVYLRSFWRLSWLVPKIFLTLAAASIIALYKDTIEAVVALAVFLPVVSDLSGCSGNQAVAVSMRELTLGLIRPTEFLRVIWKEVTLGLFNGAILGILIATIAGIWKQNLYLGLVIGLALALNTVISVVLGGLVPMFLKRFKMDPALASTPILTTCTDMCGFFLVLSLAGLAMEKLV